MNSLQSDDKGKGFDKGLKKSVFPYNRTLHVYRTGFANVLLLLSSDSE